MQNNIKVMLGLLIVIAGVAYWVAQNQTNIGSGQQQMLIPSWQNNDESVTAIDKIILKKGQQQLQLVKAGQLWQLQGGFYLSPEPLFELIQSLRNAEIKELKTANPAKHAQLELAADDMSVHIYQNEQLQHAIHIGKKSPAGLTFVRRVGEDQTYAVSGVEPISLNVDNWLLKTVLDIDPQTVTAVSIKSHEGEAVEINRNVETGALELVNMPAGQQLKTNSNLQQAMGGLSRLMIDEAMSAESSPLAATDENDSIKLISATYQLASGETVVLDMYSIDETYYMTIDSAQHPQYQGWVMKIAEYKFNAINRKLSDFIEPVIEDESVNDAAETEIE